MRRRSPILALLLLFSSTAVARAAPGTAAAPTFARRWSQDDAPVASGTQARSWTWGPAVIRAAAEPYKEAPNGRREVWYLDKARMEITHPEADTNAPWYITTGLLVRELISGKVQLGDADYEEHQPAPVPVAGDLEADLLTTITYADLRPLAAIDGVGGRAEPAQPDDPPLAATIAPGGAIGIDDHFASYNVHAGAYDDVLGRNVAKVFVDALGADTLLYVAGRPLTEPLWTRVPVNRQPRDVLVQAFERRVLTYTPANPDAWRVEWGNVGRQYAQWRYGSASEGAPFDPATGATPVAGIHELSELSPEAAETARVREGYVGAAVYRMDTGTLYSFHSDYVFAMYSTVKVPIMLALLDGVRRQGRGVSDWERSRLEAMIKVSDNVAASQLLGAAGGAASVEGYLRSIGIANTHINADAWGASMTTAGDMALLMAKLGDGVILTPSLCQYALDLMRNVDAKQRWGVSAGLPPATSVALKNGWYPDRRGWGINSIGFVSDAGKRYAIAIYTNPDPSMQYGIDTIEQMSSQIYPAIR